MICSLRAPNEPRTGFCLRRRFSCCRARRAALRGPLAAGFVSDVDPVLEDSIFMKYVSILFAAAAMLVGSAASAVAPMQFPISAQNGSGEHGTATMLQGSAGV